MEWVPLVAALLAIPAVVWGIAAALRQQRQREERKAADLATLGLYPLAQPDPAAIGKVIALLRRRGENLVAKSVYAKQRGDVAVYLLDLWATGGKQSRRVEEYTLAAVSARLRVPRFSAFPRLPVEGIAMRVANAVLRNSMSRAGTMLDLSGAPDIDRRYAVASHQPEEVRPLLDAGLLSCLGRTEFLRIEADNDTLVLHRLHLPGKYRRTGTHDLRSLLEDLMALALSLERAARREHTRAT